MPPPSKPNGELPSDAEKGDAKDVMPKRQLSPMIQLSGYINPTVSLNKSSGSAPSMTSKMMMKSTLKQKM